MECSDLVLILLDLIKICNKITRHYFRLRDFNFKYLSAIYESPEGLFEIRDSKYDIRQRSEILYPSDIR